MAWLCKRIGLVDLEITVLVDGVTDFLGGRIDAWIVVLAIGCVEHEAIRDLACRSCRNIGITKAIPISINKQPGTIAIRIKNIALTSVRSVCAITVRINLRSRLTNLILFGVHTRV